MNTLISIAIAPIVGCAPVVRPVEGHPIGNGRMGTLVWTTPGAIEFQINRVDVFAVNRGTAGRHYAKPDTATTDSCTASGRVSIGVGGDPFRPGPHFAQRLSLADARCEVRGEHVQAACWVAAEDDVLVVQVTDERETPQPIEVTLAMWRDPRVQTGGHVAAYEFRPHVAGVAVVQTFREADHYCASAVAVACPGAETLSADKEARSRMLRLPAARGTPAGGASSGSGPSSGFKAPTAAARAPRYGE